MDKVAGQLRVEFGDKAYEVFLHYLDDGCIIAKHEVCGEFWSFLRRTATSWRMRTCQKIILPSLSQGFLGPFPATSSNSLPATASFSG